MDQARPESAGGGERPVTHYPCPNCGAELRFAPKLGGLHCEYCEYEEMLRVPGAPEYDLEQGLRRDAEPVEEGSRITCPKCAADYDLPPRRFSAVCPYCETPAILPARNPLPPDGVLPFRIDEKEAHDLFARWIGSLWLAPSELAKRVDANKRLEGLYLPYWLFDASSESYYEGERGDAYYVTVIRTQIVNGQRREVAVQERRIRWSPASGYVRVDFDALPILAESEIPPRLLEAIRPWPVRDAWRFETKALCGFESREYARRLAPAHRDARELMAQKIRWEVARDIGGDEQRIYRIDTRWEGERYQNVLLPVWTTHFVYKGKTYHYVINGVTGVVAGERPYSWWKVGALVLLGAALMLLAFYWADLQAQMGY